MYPHTHAHHALVTSMVSTSTPRLLFLLALATLHGGASGQVAQAVSKASSRRFNATQYARVNATRSQAARGVDGNGVTGVNGESHGSVAPPPPTGDRLRAELWGCRVMCRDEKWAPVCHRGGTFANECWVHCSTSVFSSDDDDEDVTTLASSSSSSSINVTNLRAARGGGGNHSRFSGARTNATRESVVVTTTPGMCDPSMERFRPDDHSCIQDCVAVWGEIEGGGGGGGGGGQFARWRPACGEDGVTYTTACFAACSGVRSAEGACHDITPLDLRRRRRRKR